jgi:hypothetical protein
MIRDPRGPNIIPFGRRTLDALRKRTINKPAPPERPWPFNALGPSPYHRSTLPPVPRDRTQYGTGRTQFGEDAFTFKEECELRRAIGQMPKHPDELNRAIMLTVEEWMDEYPGHSYLDVCMEIMRAVRFLLLRVKLPPR